jgi:hypothetical protein
VVEDGPRADAAGIYCTTDERRVENSGPTHRRDIRMTIYHSMVWGLEWLISAGLAPIFGY